MKQFKFPLQKVLDLREFYEKQAEIALGKVISEKEKIDLELNNIAQSRIQVKNELLRNFNISEIRMVDLYIQRLDKKRETLLEEIAKIELIIEKKRLEMQEAMKNRKILTKLKEKESMSYRKQMQQLDAVILDDIISSTRDININDNL